MALNRPKKPQKPLGFSKTVVTRYLAPEASADSRRGTQRRAQPGRPSVRLVKQAIDSDADDLAPIVAVPAPARRPDGSQPLAGVGRQKSIR